MCFFIFAPNGVTVDFIGCIDVFHSIVQDQVFFEKVSALSGVKK